ncbi:MAG: zinc ribbon domain-containing protein [Ruminococcus sp.]|nr:zinc ribbon domain-containing protein [Ruminococcus sp.]
MECPKCHKPVGDNDKTCKNCGTRVRADDVYALRRKRISDKTNAIDVTPSGKSSAAVKKGIDVGSGKIKLIAIAVAAVLVVILAIVIIASVTGSKGAKKAESIAEYIGARPEVAQTKTEIDFKKESAFNVLNKAVEFDFIVEAEDEITSSGINFPEWAIFIDKSKKGNIKSVRYVDFKTIEDNINGEKRSSAVNLDKYNKGTDVDNILDEMKSDPYAVKYTKDGTIYTFRYWYKSDSGDRQAVILDIAADTDGKYQGYESKLVYPNDL